MDKVRYGVIGCGNITNGFHLPDMKAIETTELIAVADMVEEKARLMAEKFGAKAYYSDYKQLLKRTDIDAVIVATWHPTHSPIAVEVLEAGKHVLVQKPMATSIEDANKLVETTERHPELTAMSLPYNWSPSYELAKRLIDNGAIGRVTMARSRSAHSGPLPSPHPTSWFLDKRRAIVGVFFDLGVYSVTTLTDLLGPAETAVGYSKTLGHDANTYQVPPGQLTDDSSVVVIELKSGAIGIAEASWCQMAGWEGTAIYGTEGTIYLNWRGEPLNVYITKPSGGWLKPDLPPAPGQDAHRHFVDCILQGKEPRNTPKRARHVVEIMLACYESEVTGQRVNLKTSL